MVGPNLEVKEEKPVPGKKKSRNYSNKTKSCLNIITAIAVGALLGDALIHIIPHSFEDAELLAAEAKGLEDPHAGHGHRMLLLQ